MANVTDRTGQDLLDLVYKDELTKIHNRRYFNREFPKLCEKAVKEEKPFSFLMIDVDHFKGVNDTYGHEKGDEVLSAVASQMVESTGDDGLPIRFAGDEFLILLPDKTKDEGLPIGERVRKGVADMVFKTEDEKDEFSVSLSIGLASFPDDTDDPSELQHLADQAAYISKKMGKNRVSTLEEEAPPSLDVTSMYRYFPSRTLIGREDIIQEIPPYISPAPIDQRPILVFHGLPGSGKTRLLDEVASNTDQQRCFKIQTHGSVYTVGQPFSELLEPISRILNDNPEVASRAVLKMDSVHLRSVLYFLPVLSRHTINQTKTSSLSPRQKKDVLLEGLKELIITISEERPLIIFFDEFHLANMGTRLLLSNVKSDPRSKNVALFCTSCDKETAASKDEDLIEFYNRHSEDGILIKHPVKPFSEGQVRQLIDSILKGLGEKEKFVSFVYEHSDGYPGKVENVLKKMIFKKIIYIDEGEIALREYQQADLFETTEIETVSSEEVIDREIQQLLTKASVMGREFNMDVLKQLDGRSESQLSGILHKAEKADLIKRKVKGENDVYEFRQEAIEKDFYKDLKEEDRKELHVKVGDAEKEKNSDRVDMVLSKLAYHFEQGGEKAKSLEFLSQIANEFNGLFSPAQIELHIGKLPEIDQWEEEKKLSHEEEKEALHVCKRLKIALDNLDTYPFDSEIVRGSMDAAFIKLRKILEKVEILSFSDAEGVLILNNERPATSDSDEYYEEDFLKLLEKANLKGIAFRKGLTKKEFFKVTSILVNFDQRRLTKAGGWRNYLKEEDVKNVKVNQRVFVSMGLDDLKDAKRIKSRRRRARGAAQKPTSQEQAIKEVKEVFSGDLMEKLEMLKDKYSENKELNTFLDEFQETLNKITRNSELLEQLTKAVNQPEKEPEIIKAETPAPTSAPVVQVSFQNSDSAIALNKAAERKKTASKDPGLDKVNLAALEKLKEDTDVLIHELEYEDMEVVKLAGAALMLKGKEVVDPLFKFVINTSNSLARKTALLVLKKYEPTIGRRFVEALTSDTNAREKENILTILKDFSGIPYNDVSLLLLADDDSRVRRSFLSEFEKVPTPERLNILHECLKDEDEETVCDVIFSLGRIGNKNSIPPLIEMIEKKWIIFNDVRFKAQEAACKVLGQIGGDEALAALSKALKLTPSILLKRNKPASVRAAAAFALGYFPIHKVKDLLESAKRDPSPVVRSAASLALKMSTEGQEKKSS